MNEPERIDLCAIYDVKDDPSPGLFDDWQGTESNPFHGTTLRKIGNTWYIIRTECGGTEPLKDKVKRLIFTDPMPEKAVFQG